jgi:hypothetical protein
MTYIGYMCDGCIGDTVCIWGYVLSDGVGHRVRNLGFMCLGNTHQRDISVFWHVNYVLNSITLHPCTLLSSGLHPCIQLNTNNPRETTYLTDPNNLPAPLATCYASSRHG